MRSCLSDGEKGKETLNRLLQTREKEENLTPRLYADPHWFIFKFFTKLEKVFTKAKLSKP